MSSHFTSFAVAGGSGMVGSAIVAGLLSAHAGRVIVLSRSADTQVPEGVEVKAVNFDSSESVEKAIEGIDVVICTLRDSQATQEPLLARACKEAGTKLFLPSEFGSDLTGMSPGIMYQKIAIAQVVKDLDLPNLRVYNGVWHETTFLPNRFGYDLIKGKVEIVGTGDEPWSFTSVKDVGAFVGKLLLTLPAEELTKLGSVSIEGERLTPNEVVKLWEKTHPDQAPLEVLRTPLADSQEFTNKCEGFQYFTRALVNLWAQPGPGSADVTFGGKVKLANELVDGWKSTGVEEFLRGMEEEESVPGWKFYEA